MDVSLRVKGIKPPDEKWRQMKAAWDACVAACVPVPEEVKNFFGREPPDAAGVVVEHRTLETINALKTVGGDMWEGFEIDLSRLPGDVKILRVTNHF